MNLWALNSSYEMLADYLTFSFLVWGANLLFSFTDVLFWSLGFGYEILNSFTCSSSIS